MASAWWVGRLGIRPRGEGYWRWQVAGSLFRLLVIFGTAHLLWRRRHDAKEVVIFIFAAVILQLIGGAYLVMRSAATESHG